MRIFLASDVHFEFYNDVAWLPPLPAADLFDVLILAGDIGHGPWLSTGLHRLRKRYPGKPIVYVAGNHEFYRGNITQSPLKDVDIADFHYLEKSSVELCGYQFLGTALWTGFDCLGHELIERAMHVAKYSIADFMEIRIAELSETNGRPLRVTPEFMRDLYHQAKAWLDAELAHLDPDKTIVVTHFPPARECRHGRIAEDDITAYFQANCMDLIQKHQPCLWLYGHNHWSNEHKYGKTRAISNQYGYPSEHTGYRA
ncbi:MAG TPA: metallophosphoesterase, partial [Pseudomonadales bacterium]|nr:metallophosphoesterase [Pseudomonadales bacterium]